MTQMEKLNKIRSFTGKAYATGLSDQVIEKFLKIDSNLVAAIDTAYDIFQSLQKEFPETLKKDEIDQINEVQEGYVNFYSEHTINPYLAIAAQGPWIVSVCGAVIHDSGGYGMLGGGHNPLNVVSELNKNQVIANIMTANYSQKRLIHLLGKEIGHKRSDNKRFKKFLCLNSGSESVTVASRLSDINARIQLEGKHKGKTVKFLAFAGGFHGRTDRPAQNSDSCLAAYKKHLASFKDRDNLVTIQPNNIEQLKETFAKAEKENVFFESFFIEPVMGEGDPGKAVTPEYYKVARELTRANHTLFLVDSIQAGLRAQGCLSIIDYPGFETLDPPDMETYSKALNAGQYPLSVLAMTEEAAALHQRGIYGNTMTTNPRALDIACAVLEGLDDSLRKNIVEKGHEFLDKLNVVAKEFPGLITKVQGTGLLFSAEVDGNVFEVVAEMGLEKYLRINGMGVIHGGENSLRFTPHFKITSEEIDMMMDLLRDAIKNAPRKA